MIFSTKRVAENPRQKMGNVLQQGGFTPGRGRG